MLTKTCINPKPLSTRSSLDTPITCSFHCMHSSRIYFIVQKVPHHPPLSPRLNRFRMKRAGFPHFLPDLPRISLISAPGWDFCPHGWFVPARIYCTTRGWLQIRGYGTQKPTFADRQ